MQHIYTLLKVDGRAGVVLPDNVLFEGGAGERVRRNLLEKCRVHTLLRLPTGIWYSPGVKANVVFFDKKEGRAEAWTGPPVGLRSAHQHALHAEAENRSGARTSTSLSNATGRGACTSRAETWSEDTPDGRWRCYDYEDLLKRDKLSLDLFWIKDESLTDTDSLPAPGVIAAEIAEDLEAAPGAVHPGRGAAGRNGRGPGSILKSA